MDWCHERGASARRATLPQVADFLIFLREVKKLTLPTIKGYRAAIALVLRANNTDVSGAPELNALLRSMTLELPPERSKTPKWDLSVALAALLEAPYEPLDKAELKFLTHKTVFLLAFASAKRVSELQALSGAFQHKPDWSAVSFDFAENFLAKNQIPDGTRNKLRAFLIPALGRGASDQSDLLLCPIRALRIYFRRTSDRRTRDSHLLIPILGRRPSVTKNTISNWITSVVRGAYDKKHVHLHQLHRVSAHEVRALATSWQFRHTLSLEAVMDAASWRSHSTFSSFYLRDVTFIADDLLKLGPVVAAQRVV